MIGIGLRGEALDPVGLKDEIARAVNDRAPLVNFDALDSVRPMGEEHVGAGIDHLVREVCQPRPLLMRMDREHYQLRVVGRLSDRRQVLLQVARVDPPALAHAETIMALHAQPEHDEGGIVKALPTQTREAAGVPDRLAP